MQDLWSPFTQVAIQKIDILSTTNELTMTSRASRISKILTQVVNEGSVAIQSDGAGWVSGIVATSTSREIEHSGTLSSYYPTWRSTGSPLYHYNNYRMFINGVEFNGPLIDNDLSNNVAALFSDFKIKLGKHYHYSYYDWLTRWNMLCFDLSGAETIFPKPVAV